MDILDDMGVKTKKNSFLFLLRQRGTPNHFQIYELINAFSLSTVVKETPWPQQPWQKTKLKAPEF